MLDLVYKLTQGKTKSKTGDLELRYSLRSVEKYMTGFGKVWIVGDMPQFETVGIGYIPHTDTAKSKQGNLFDKLIAVSGHPEVSDRFIDMDDDYIFFRPLDIRRLHILYDGKIVGSPNDECGGFARSIRRAGQILAENGKSIYWTAGHYPMPIVKDRFLELQKYNREWRDKPGGVNPRALYGNWYRQHQLEKTVDIKVYDERTMEEAIAKGDENTFNVSLSDRAMENPDIRNWLKTEFPNKSRWEK